MIINVDHFIGDRGAAVLGMECGDLSPLSPSATRRAPINAPASQASIPRQVAESEKLRQVAALHTIT